MFCLPGFKWLAGKQRHQEQLATLHSMAGQIQLFLLKDDLVRLC